MFDAMVENAAPRFTRRAAKWPSKLVCAAHSNVDACSGEYTCEEPSAVPRHVRQDYTDSARTPDNLFLNLPSSRFCSKSDRSCSSGCLNGSLLALPRQNGFPEFGEAAPQQPDYARSKQKERCLNVCRHKRIYTIPIPDEVAYRGVVYRFGKLLGKGGFGQVFAGKLDRVESAAYMYTTTVPVKVALKVQASSENGRNDALREYEALRMLQGLPGVPNVYAQVPLATDATVHIMAMQRLGRSVWDEFLGQDKELLGAAEIACIAVEALWILANIHNAGWVHRDVKPENFVLQQDSRKRQPRLYLIDFGMATRWRQHNGEALPYGQRLTDFWGTARYASAHAHLGRTAAPRDDLHSLAYTLLYLAKGELPWQHLDKTADMHVRMASMKIATPPEALCLGLHPVFLQFLCAVLTLPYDRVPPYSEYIAMFAPLAASLQPHLRPVTVTAPRPTLSQLCGVKRPFSELSNNDAPARLPPAARSPPSSGRHAEWITVHSRGRPVKQRYHHNVSTPRLKHYVNRGFLDSMFVTHVVHDGSSDASSWTIVMDDGPRYESQELYVASLSMERMRRQACLALNPEAEAENFLPQEWIMSMWQKNSFITSLAASSMGELLVVMSKGVPYRQQAYRCSHTFPYAWVHRKWKAGFRITSLCCAPWSQCWAVVMSQGTPYSEQMIELDFKYPSDGIQQYWNQGLHITCCAASKRETVFVLSRDRSSTGVCHQETARSPSFPVDHVMENWRKDYFITAICYGPAQG